MRATDEWTKNNKGRGMVNSLQLPSMDALTDIHADHS